MSELIITPEQTKEFHRAACERWHAHIADKNDSSVISAVASLLDTMKILDKEEFMENYTITLLDTIYPPYDVGVPDNYSLWDQVETLVHELVHVQQYRDDKLGFPFRYVADKSARAEYEAKAYAADMEMFYWRTGKLYDIRARAQVLENYALEQEHINFAASLMESIGATIEAGAAVNDIAAWSMDWLEQQGIK